MVIDDGFDFDTCMDRLSRASYGRVVMWDQGQPTVELVGCLVDAGTLVMQVRHGSVTDQALRLRSPVAFEADAYDDETCIGWWVTVTGVARTVIDGARLTRYAHAADLSGVDVSRYVLIDHERVEGGSFVPSAVSAGDARP